MKLLHTSDLHLGDTWSGHSRRADQERVLDEILGLCDRHAVDALIITGDIFSDRVEGGRHAVVARRFLERLRPQLRQGRPVFLLRGNHDPRDLFTLLEYLLGEFSGTGWPLVVADRPAIHHLPGLPLQVVALPYLSPGWLRMQPAPPDTSPEEQVAGLAGLLAAHLGALYRTAVPDLPAIFAGHVSIRGARITEDREFESGYHRELWLEPRHLPYFTSYNALGHIHLSQEVDGAAKPTWYAGGPDRLNLGEREYHPRVLLVTIPDQPGGTAGIEPIALTTCTAFVERRLDGSGAVGAFCAAVDVQDPLGQVLVAGVAEPERGTVEAQLRRAAPRLRIAWERDDLPPPVAAPDGPDYHDVAGTVEAYLGRAHERDPERRERLVAAFRALWSEQDGEVAR